MPYLGTNPEVGLVTKLNDIASGFNGVTTTFQLAIPPGGVTNYFTPGTVNALFVRLGGVTQNPGVDYTVSGSQITFTTAPASGLTCFIIAIGQAINIGTPADGSVGQSKLGTITSLPLTGTTSGTTTLAPPAVAGNNTITLPANNGSANQLLKNSGTAGTLTYGTATEDSSGNFAFNSGYGSVATAYGCRAWVNFNGTGTVAIRSSGNVSSITDNGVGDYTVNFTTAMPDANYVVVCENSRDNAATTAGPWIVAPYGNSSTGPLLKTSSQIKIATSTLNGALVDYQNLSVAVFR